MKRVNLKTVVKFLIALVFFFYINIVSRMVDGIKGRLSKDQVCDNKFNCLCWLAEPRLACPLALCLPLPCVAGQVKINVLGVLSLPNDSTRLSTHEIIFGLRILQMARHFFSSTL